MPKEPVGYQQNKNMHYGNSRRKQKDINYLKSDTRKIEK